MKTTLNVIFIAATLFLASTTNASLIFDNGSDTDNIGGWCASCGMAGEESMFDDFTLTDNYSGLIIEWDAGFLNAADRNINIGIWASPNSNLLYSTTFSFSGNDYSIVNKNYSWGQNITTAFTLNNVNLLSGTYWLSLSGDNMYFSTSLSGGNGFQVEKLHLNDGINYNGASSPEKTVPFRLYGAPSTSTSTAPEPSSLILLALGVLGLGARRLAKK